MKAGIGLDLGATCLRMAVVRPTRSGPALLGYAVEPLSVMTDTAGIDPLAITTGVRSLLKRLKPPKAGVSLGLLEQRVVAREVELPWVPAKELRQALPMLASDLLPVAVEESVLDFLPAEEVVDNDGARSLRGLLVAANEAMITTVVEAIEEAGLRVDQVTLSPLAALPAVCDPGAVYAEALLDIGGETTCLVVHEGNRPTFVRVMAKGGNSVTESLAEQFGIDAAAAEEWKRGVGWMWQGMSQEDRQRTQSSLTAASTSLIEEIRSSVMFYRSTTGNPISRIWLVGGGAAQFGLDYQLRDAVHSEIRRATPADRLAGVTGDAAVDTISAEAASAIGLAMGAMS